MDFFILNGDTVAAEWKNNEFKVIHFDMLPLYLQRTSDVQKWLETRAIDSHRAIWVLRWLNINVERTL